MTLEQLRAFLEQNYVRLVKFARPFLPDCEDVLHEKILQLLAEPDCLAAVDPANPNAYFFAVVRNAFRSHGRRLARRPPPAPLLADVLDPTAFRPEEVSLDEAKENARAILRSVGLTEKEQRAFATYWAVGWRRPDALAILGLTGGTPQELFKDYDGPLNRARRKMWTALQPHRDLLESLGYHWLWHAVNEEICRFPGAPE